MLQFIEQQLRENGMDDIITSQGNILTSLYENDGKLTMSQIAQKIGKDKSTVTPLINKLSKLDYTYKEKNENDKRIPYITLTPKGLALKSKFNSISEKVYETAYNDFTEEEKEILLRLLKKLNT